MRCRSQVLVAIIGLNYGWFIMPLPIRRANYEKRV
nr:MAG TPA: hypothetical protein [Bacteriophage sp.]